MGREIKRVSLDFDFPWNDSWAIWTGYQRPDSLQGTPCPDCDGSGQTHFGWWLQKFSYLMGMLADDVRDQENGKPMHPWLVEFPNGHGHWEYLVDGTWGIHPSVKGEARRAAQHRYVVDRPSKDALTFFARLTDQPEDKVGGGIFSSGSDIKYAVMQKLCEVTGVDVACQTCEGQGSTEVYPGQRAEAEAWEPTEPPEGPGYQLWETVSEGSPITPVFATPEELAHWMTEHSWGSQKDKMASSFDVAMRFIEAGWAPSGIASAEHGVETGVEAVGRA